MTLRRLHRALHRAGQVSVDGVSVVRHAGHSIGARVVAVGGADGAAVLFATSARDEAPTLRALHRALRRAGKVSVDGVSVLRLDGSFIGARVVAVGRVDGAVLFANKLEAR